MTLKEIEQFHEKLQKMLKPYQEFYANLSKTLEPLNVSLNAQTFMDTSIYKQQIAALNSIKESIQPPMGTVRMLEGVANMTAVRWGDWECSKFLAEINKSILGAYQPIKINEDTLKAIVGIANVSTYEGLVNGVNSLCENLPCLVNDICKEFEDKLESESDFISNEELEEAIIEQNENPIGFQERIANWTEEKKKKYCIAVFILMFVWNNFVAPYFQQEIGIPVMAWTVSHVKELPEKTGKYITDLKEDIEAIVIENVPYYYKVSFVDENGKLKEGYVSKRSVKRVETVIEEEEAQSELEGQTSTTE